MNYYYDKMERTRIKKKIIKIYIDNTCNSSICVCTLYNFFLLFSNPIEVETKNFSLKYLRRKKKKKILITTTAPLILSDSYNDFNLILIKWE